MNAFTDKLFICLIQKKLICSIWNDDGIVADRILVRGNVDGNITAKKLVFVASTGVVKGDIVAGQVVLEPGSMFTGRCTMTKGM